MKCLSDAPDTQHPFSRHLPGLPRLNASDLKVLEDLPNTMVGWFGNRSWHHDMIFLEAVMISTSYTYFCQVIECEHQKSKRVVSNQWEVVSIEGPLVIEQHPLEDWTFPKSLRAAQALLLSPKPQIRRSGWYNLDFSGSRRPATSGNHHQAPCIPCVEWQVIASVAFPVSNAWPKKIRATGTRRFDTSFIRMDLETNKTYVKVSGPGLWFTSFWGQVSGFKFNMDHDNLRNLFAWRKPRQLVLFHREIEIWNYKFFWKVSVHESVEVHMVLILSSWSRTAFRGILRGF